MAQALLTVPQALLLESSGGLCPDWLEGAFEAAAPAARWQNFWEPSLNEGGSVKVEIGVPFHEAIT